MRLSFVVLSFAVATVLAQAPPDCTIPCLTNTSNYDGCRGDDTPCLCHSAVFVSRTTACIEAACTGQALQDALTYSQDVCKSVGVTLTSSAPQTTQTTPAADNSSSTDSSSQTTSAPQTTNSPNGALMQRVHAAAALAAIGGIFSLVL